MKILSILQIKMFWFSKCSVLNLFVSTSIRRYYIWLLLVSNLSKIIRTKGFKKVLWVWWIKLVLMIWNHFNKEIILTNIWLIWQFSDFFFWLSLMTKKTHLFSLWTAFVVVVSPRDASPFKCQLCAKRWLAALQSYGSNLDCVQVSMHYYNLLIIVVFQLYLFMIAINDLKCVQWLDFIIID